MNASAHRPGRNRNAAAAQFGACRRRGSSSVDDSEAHRGHGGYNPAGESHFSLTIESPAFAGKSRVERQRLVYAALGDLMRERVHALVDQRDRTRRMRGGAQRRPLSS